MHLLHRIYEDTKNQQLEICCDRRTNDWVVYARHSVDGRGASCAHDTENAAKQAFKRLNDTVKDEGWNGQIVKRVSKGFVGGPARMLIVDGERFFRDPWTGDRIFDLSCWRPLKVHNIFTKPEPVPNGLTVFACRRSSKQNTGLILTIEDADAFTLNSLPVPEEL